MDHHIVPKPCSWVMPAWLFLSYLRKYSRFTTILRIFNSSVTSAYHIVGLVLDGNDIRLLKAQERTTSNLQLSNDWRKSMFFQFG
jgi:hypothetical protein